MTDPRRAAGYIRISPIPQANILMSLGHQQRTIVREADRRGYVIVQWYLDDGVKITVELRPDLQCLINDICSVPRGYQALFVASASRLSRDSLEFEEFRSKLLANGVQLYSAERFKDPGKYEPASPRR